jgi:hypothetical protein
VRTRGVNELLAICRRILINGVGASRTGFVYQTVVVLIAQEGNGDRPEEKQSLRERIDNAARTTAQSLFLLG